jgi:hypothetical protein
MLYNNQKEEEFYGLNYSSGFPCSYPYVPGTNFLLDNQSKVVSLIYILDKGSAYKILEKGTDFCPLKLVDITINDFSLICLIASLRNWIAGIYVAFCNNYINLFNSVSTVFIQLMTNQCSDFLQKQKVVE